MSVSEDFAFKLLAFLVRDEQFCADFFERVPPEYFEIFPVFERIYLCFRDYVEHYGEMPSPRTLREIVIRRPPEDFEPLTEPGSEEERKDFEQLLDDIEQEELSDREWMSEQLTVEGMRSPRARRSNGSRSFATR